MNTTTMEATKPIPTQTQKTARWAANNKAVRRALKWIRSKGHVSLEELVEWDRAHGQELFTWNQARAAEIGRLEEARIFMNRFRSKFDGMRIRAFIRIREDEDAAIEESAYYSVEDIAQHPGMRSQVIADIAKRMAGLASELRMWRLSSDEREELFARLRAELEK